MDRGLLDLGSLVQNLPQLIGIDIWSVMDNPQYRRRGLEARSWTYSDSLFDALKQGHQRLRHFHWNARLMGKHASDPMAMYQWMHTIHQMPTFQSLTYIKLTSFFGDSAARTDLIFPVDYASPGKVLTMSQQNKEATRLQKQDAQRLQDEGLADALRALPNLRKLDLYMSSIACLLQQFQSRILIKQVPALPKASPEEAQSIRIFRKKSSKSFVCTGFQAM